MRPIEASPRSNRLTTQPSAIIGQLSIVEVDGERDELAERDGARDHHAAAEPDDGHAAEAHQEADPGVQDAGDAHEPPAARHVLVVRRGEARLLGASCV